MKYRTLVLIAAMLALVACASKDKKLEKPAELTDIKNPTVRIQKLWGASVGGGGKKLRLGLGLATAGDRLFQDVTATSRRSISRVANNSGALKPSWSSPEAPVSAAMSLR